MTPLGEVIVFSPVTGAGSCLGLKLAGEATTLIAGANRLQAKEANLKLRENMMDKDKTDKNGPDGLLAKQSHHANNVRNENGEGPSYKDSDESHLEGKRPR